MLENQGAFKALEDFLKHGRNPKNNEFIFHEVPETLKYAGVSGNEIVIRTSVINKARKDHLLSDGEITDAIKNIAAPVLVFDSDQNSSENKKRACLALTDTFTEDGKPVAFSMNLDSEYERNRSALTVNEIRSIHGRTPVSKNGTDLIQKWTAEGLCRYVDDKKISAWQLAAGVQFPLAVLHPDNDNLTQNDISVNKKQDRVPTFSDFMREREQMEKEYNDYIDSITYDEETSKRIDSGEIFSTYKDIEKEGIQMENIREENDGAAAKEGLLTPAEYLARKISAGGTEVHLSREEMRSILDAGHSVEKLAVKYGTNLEMSDGNSFNGYGTYVVSVNEENARQLGIKIAARKFGGTFYINNRPLAEFLEEKNFSPYWTKRLEQFKSHSADDLAGDFLSADLKGNAALGKEQQKLSTLFSLGLIEYKREQTYIYSVDIPDHDGSNYLLYNNPVGLEHAERINGELAKLGVEWRVSRNDIGRDVYFDLLSDKVFDGNQRKASEFLKNKAGYVGLKMDDANYIVFDDRDMNVTNRVQYMKSESGEVYGFAFDGGIYVDEDLVNSNVLAHEYTHLWDKYIRNENPGLWEKGKHVFQNTHLWSEIISDPNYKDIAGDEDLVMSECHSRIAGKFAEQVLARIEERDGGIAKDAVIDWEKEANEFVARELLAPAELGDENYVSDSVRSEYLKMFLSMPMKDLMNEVRIGMEKEISGRNIPQERSGTLASVRYSEIALPSGALSALDFGFSVRDGESVAETLGRMNPDIFPGKEDIRDISLEYRLMADGSEQFLCHHTGRTGTLTFLDGAEGFALPEEIRRELRDAAAYHTSESFGLEPAARLAKENAAETALSPEETKEKFILLYEQIKDLDETGFRSLDIGGEKLVPVYAFGQAMREAVENGESVERAAEEFARSEIARREMPAFEAVFRTIGEGGIPVRPVTEEMTARNGTEEEIVPPAEEMTKETQGKEREGIKLSSLKQGDAIPEFFLTVSDGSTRRMTDWHFDSLDKESGTVSLRNPDGEIMRVDGATLETALDPWKANGRIDDVRTETAEKQTAFVEGVTKVPEFAVITQDGLKTYRDMIVTERNDDAETWTLSNGDGERITLPDSTVRTLLSDAAVEKAKGYAPGMPEYEKVIEEQYDSFFRPRENTAGHFRHNLSVYCRKEANSPLDAVKIASELVKRMPEGERNRTRELLEKMRGEGETVNQVIVRTYLEAVKDVPMNAEYLTKKRYEKLVAQPMYDTVSEKGERIDKACPLRIGDSVTGMEFKTDRVFGKGSETLRQDCTVIAASKENNTVTLMAGDKSFFEVPRDSFIADFNSRLEKSKFRQQETEKSAGRDASSGSRPEHRRSETKRRASVEMER